MARLVGVLPQNQQDGPPVPREGAAVELEWNSWAPSPQATHISAWTSSASRQKRGS